jgi:hypothetical protein
LSGFVYRAVNPVVSHPYRFNASYTFPLMLCHLGAFLGRPLMRVSNLPRTVWK